MKKSPKIDLNKAKFCSKRGFLHVYQKYSKKFLLFYVKKTIKECLVSFSIKSNRKHHKTVLYSKSNKNIVGATYCCPWVIFSKKHLVTLSKRSSFRQDA